MDSCKQCLSSVRDQPAAGTHSRPSFLASFCDEPRMDKFPKCLWKISRMESYDKELTEFTFSDEVRNWQQLYFLPCADVSDRGVAIVELSTDTNGRKTLHRASEIWSGSLECKEQSRNAAEVAKCYIQCPVLYGTL